MESVRLPPRLAAVAEMVPAGSKLIDVGTDHGLLPICLLQEGRIVSAVASDIRTGPLSRARANAARHHTENIRFVLCDGLSGISPEEADTIVIAGMGGETIASIISSAPWCREKILLLQPMSRPEVLRKFLCSSELRITEETLVKDGGRIYSVIKAEKGEPLALSEAELYVGPAGLISKQPLFTELTEQRMKKIRNALDGISRSGSADDEQRARHLINVYEQLQLMISDTQG